MARRHLIIIPGLGDRGGWYRFLVPLWSLLGFKVHIFVLGWEDPSTPFATSFERLLSFIDRLGECHIIGVSAGGTAAVSALGARPNAIRSVVTVCTPYFVVPGLSNEKLRDSLERLATVLPRLGAGVTHRILSVHGLYDDVVPVAMSKPAGIAHRAVFAVGHGLTICLTLTLYCAIPWRSLRRQHHL